MRSDPSTRSLILVGLLVGVLATSWWIAFDRGRQWRSQAETVVVDRDRLATESDALRTERDAAIALANRIRDQAVLDESVSNRVTRLLTELEANSSTCATARVSNECPDSTAAIEELRVLLNSGQPSQ